MINVDAYHFFAFSVLACDLEDTGLDVFWLQFSMIVRRSNLKIVTKRLLHLYLKMLG